MKKTLLLSIVLVLIGLNSFAQWEFQNPLPTGNSLRSVCFPNVNTGYAVGDFGIIIKTLDGGINWTPLSSGTTIPLNSVYFTDINTGYAVGGKYNGGQINISTAIILKTTDGGTNWDSVFLSTNVYFSSVFFTNANTGYAVGYGVTLSFGGIKYGIIFKTTDGGTTWITQYSGPWNNFYFNSVHFPEVNKGYVVGSDGTIFLTIDGGETWTAIYSNGNQVFNSVFFTDDNTGYVVGFNLQLGLEKGIILKTIDGGSSWTDQYPSESWLTSVHFVNANSGFVGGYDGTILKTTDAGATWNSQISGTTHNLNSVYFADVNNGCEVGDFGTILKTSDGGTTWTAQSSSVTTSTLKSVYFSDPNNGHAVGWNDGPPVNTTTAGIPWTASPQYMDGSFNSVFFTDANTGFAAGTHCGEVQCWGAIDKTTDGGLTWTGVYVGDLWSSFNSVFFTDINTGYVVGGDITNVYTNGIILKTINGGADWTIVLSGSIHSLNSIFFTDANNGYAVGYGGTILKTIDGGTTWNDESVLTNYDDLYSVYFTGAETGYAVGFSVYPGIGGIGIILYTTDGGITWTTTEWGSDILLSVCFPDANTGYIVGSGGTILKTIDAGTTWITQASGTINNLNSVFFTDDHTGYAVGDGGTILKTTNGGGTVGISEKPVGGQRSAVSSYPNPFSDQTTFEYTLEESGMVTLEIFNQVGQLKAVLVNERQTTGTFQEQWDAQGLPAGIYYYSLRSGKQLHTGKVIVMK